MAEPSTFRYRILFGKTDSMRFTSHLDLHRTWERTLRRAGMPLAYTQGYSPHPRINLGAALPLGCTGAQELADVWLEQGCDPAAVRAALQEAAPPGLRVEQVSAVPIGEATLQSQIAAGQYEVTFGADAPPPDLAARVQGLLQAGSLLRRRREKEYDLRPLIEDLWLVDEAGKTPRLVMQLAAREGATGRPEEVLLALGLDPIAHVERTRLIFRSESPAFA